MTRIRMKEFRQGWFHPEPLEAGQVYDLPDKTAAYLLDLKVAETVPEPAPDEEDLPFSEPPAKPKPKGKR